jgi:hypothetical protein
MLNCSVSKAGALLADDDLEVIDLQVHDAAMDGDEADEDTPTVQAKDGLRGVYVKNVMERLVAPELKVIKRYLPECYALMKEQGFVDIVLAVDNHSRTVFSEALCKLEQAVIKILLPGINSAQQSPALAIPIFFMEGMSTHTYIFTNHTGTCMPEPHTYICVLEIDLKLRQKPSSKFAAPKQQLCDMCSCVTHRQAVNIRKMR